MQKKTLKHFLIGIVVFGFIILGFYAWRCYSSINIKPGSLVIIHGHSSCGKSSVSKALQNILAENDKPYMLIGLDSLISTLPKQWVNVNAQDTSSLNTKTEGLKYIQTSEGILQEIVIGSVVQRLLSGIGGMLNAFANSGCNVIFEGSLPKQFLMPIVTETENVKPVVVNVFCPIAIAEQREIDRKGFIGQARYQAENWAVFEDNDLVIDSSVSPEEGAKQIYQLLK